MAGIAATRNSPGCPVVRQATHRGKGSQRQGTWSRKTGGT